MVVFCRLCVDGGSRLTFGVAAECVATELSVKQKGPEMLGVTNRSSRGGARRATSFLVALPIAAALLAGCDEGKMSPVIGTVSGAVMLEGAPLAGVKIALEPGEGEQTTGADGSYVFKNVLEGDYTVTMSGHPADTKFEESATTKVGADSKEPKVDFSGDYIRTAGVSGSVKVEGAPLNGISVALTGVEAQTATTDAQGDFTFSNMRMGDYAVEISGWDPDRYKFADTIQSFSVAVGQTFNAAFAGLRVEYTFDVTITNVATFYPYFSSGSFDTPVGESEPGQAEMGMSYEFEFRAPPDTRLSFATMMVHSNDFFYAPGPEGIALWEGHDPVTGDITDQIRLWDAGTEINQEPGAGADQPARQSGPDTGADDPDPSVRLAEDEYGTLPMVDSVMTVTLESTGPYMFKVTIENISLDHTLETIAGECMHVPLSPGVFVVHYGPVYAPFFAEGEEEPGVGLEALAEDGAATTLANHASANTGLPQIAAPGVFATHESQGLLFNSGTTATVGLEAMAEDGSPFALYLDEILPAGGFRTAGVFAVPDGRSNPSLLLPGQSYSFEATAVHGEVLSLATMLAQSNDVFFAPDENGIDLFPGDNPLTGDVTGMIDLWDAGTEVNGEPGLDKYQALRQLSPNSGPDEGGTIGLLDDDFTYPDVGDMIQITVSAQPRS